MSKSTMARLRWLWGMVSSSVYLYFFRAVGRLFLLFCIVALSCICSFLQKTAFATLLGLFSIMSFLLPSLLPLPYIHTLLSKKKKPSLNETASPFPPRLFHPPTQSLTSRSTTPQLTQKPRRNPQSPNPPHRQTPLHGRRRLNHQSGSHPPPAHDQTSRHDARPRRSQESRYQRQQQ